MLAKNNFDSEQDIEIIKQIFKKISQSNLPDSLKSRFQYFCLDYRLNEKQIHVFLNVLKSDKSITAYLYRHLLKTAINVGVPNIYIQEYYMSKKRVTNKYLSSTKKDNLLKLNMLTMKLLDATIQIDRKFNSRQYKIKKLKEEIELKELEEKLIS